MNRTLVTAPPTDSLAAAGNPVAARRGRVLRPWRWALAVYGISLTIATHWPRLQLGPEVPASDKMIHLVAFGLLTLLLWRSGLFGHASTSGGRRRGALVMSGIVALLWAALDELSQGIPALGRTMSWHDMLANSCGVISALALIWAMGPLQPPDQLAAPNRARARLFEFTFDDMFATPRPWIVGAIVAIACAIVIALGRPLMPSPRSVGVFGLIVAIAGLHVLYLLYRRMFFARLKRVLAERPCLACGFSVPRGDDDADCPHCASARSRLDFVIPGRPSVRATLRVSMAPAATALAGVGLMFALVLVVPAVYAWSMNTPGRAAAPRLAQMIGRLPPELSSVIDLTIYLLLIALVTRMWRRRMAAYIDRGFRCRRCGHDLHGTPVNAKGEGHCGECGEPFARATNDT